MTPTKKKAGPGLEREIVAVAFELPAGWHWVQHGWFIAKAVKDA